MYVENADYSYRGLSKKAEEWGLADSLFPMNIDSDQWNGIGGVKEEEFSDPEKNVRAGVALIKAIQKRLDDATPAKVGSIWNFTGRENVNDFGARVQRAFDEKLWKN